MSYPLSDFGQMIATGRKKILDDVIIPEQKAMASGTIVNSIAQTKVLRSAAATALYQSIGQRAVADDDLELAQKIAEKLDSRNEFDDNDDYEEIIEEEYEDDQVDHRSYSQISQFMGAT